MCSVFFRIYINLPKKCKEGKTKTKDTQIWTGAIKTKTRLGGTGGRCQEIGYSHLIAVS